MFLFPVIHKNNLLSVQDTVIKCLRNYLAFQKEQKELEAAKERQARLDALKEELSRTLGALAVPIEGAEKALTEEEATKALDQLENNWSTDEIEAVLGEVQQLSPEEAASKRNSLDQLVQSRRFWIDKLGRKIQLYAEFNGERDQIRNRVERIQKDVAENPSGPEGLETLEVSFLGFAIKILQAVLKYSPVTVTSNFLLQIKV